MTLGERVPQIVAELAKEFRSFGGTYNPNPGFLSTVLEENRPMFAMGVDIEQVVWAVIAKLKREESLFCPVPCAHCEAFKNS